MKRNVVLFGFAILALSSPFFGIPGWTTSLATVAALFALGLIGLNLIFGVTGMLALGQAAFMALPAYVSGILARVFDMPIFVGIVCGMAIAIIVAVLLSLIFVRLPGIYFAIGTLGFAFVLEGLTRAFPPVTGGASGLVLSGSTQLSSTQWYWVACSALILGLVIYAALVRGSWKRTLQLVRQDELAAQTMGIDVNREKLKVFVVGSCYSAASGILMAYYVGVVVPETGGVNQSLELLAMLIIGGSGTFLGPVVGASIVQWLFSISGAAGHYELFVYGLAFLLVILFAPRGIVGTMEDKMSAVLRTAPPKNVHVPPGEEHIPAPARPLGQPCLIVETASKRYGGLVAVDRVSLRVSSGEIVALIGPNGAGKSTFFNLVSGIESADEGSIIIDGESQRGVSIFARAKKIGRSFQVPRLVDALSVLENVTIRVDSMHRAATERTRRKIGLAQLNDFGLSDLADKRVRELSLGYHKQIELARASIGNPPLLLMDEPAVGLTAEEVSRLAGALQRLKAQGAAILIVEHNISFVASVADKIYVMESGRLLVEGSPQEVMNNPAVKSAYLGALS